MAETKGIKETMELLEGVKLLGTDIAAIMKDGKVNVTDIGTIMHLLQNFAVLSDAVKGADLILAEAKDLSVEESQQIVAKVFEVVRAIKG